MTFPFVSKIIEAKIMWSGVSNSRELNASTTMKAFTNSFFDFSTNLFQFFSPQLFSKFSTSTTIIKTWAVPLPRQNKCRWCPSLPRQNKCRWCPSPPRQKQIQIEFTPLILASEPISVSNDSFALLMLPEEILLKIGGFCWCWSDVKFDCHL